MDEKTFVSFWEHIEALRQTLVRIFLVIFFGFIFSFCFYEPLFHLLTTTFHQRAVASPLLKQTIQRERVLNTTKNPLTYEIPLAAHVTFKQEAIEQLSSSLYRLPPNTFLEYDLPIIAQQLLILSPLEGLLMAVKVCFWAGLAITSPLWVYFALQFVLPGLKKDEKWLILPFLIGSIVCIITGCGLAYFVTIPLANNYLNQFNAEIGLNVWSLTYYIDYTLILFLGHSIAFEICLILLILVHMRILTSEWLIAKRRYMIIVAFILGAFLTPPDVLTQLMLAIPLIGVYELAILYSKIRAIPAKHYLLTRT